jgi:hypothetical protein
VPKRIFPFPVTPPALDSDESLLTVFVHLFKKRQIMEVLGILRLTDTYKSDDAWTEESYRIRSEHAAYWDEHFAAGILLHGGRIMLDHDDPRMHAVMVLNVESIEQADRLLQNDPCILQGIMRGEVLPYKGIWYKQ